MGADGRVASWTRTTPPRRLQTEERTLRRTPCRVEKDRTRAPVQRNPESVLPDVEAPPRAQTRLRQEVARRTSKRRKLAADHATGGILQRSLLEEEAVSSNAREVYVSLWRGLLDFANENALPTETPNDVDYLVVEWMNNEFMEGKQAERGSKMLAAVKYFRPEFKVRGGAVLPRATQALQGWRRHAPEQSRLPLPWEVTALIAEELATTGRPTAAVALALMHHCYLRPCEVFRLTQASAVPPIGRHRHWTLVLHPAEGLASQSVAQSSKTGEYDETIPVDSEEFSFLNAALERLRGSGCARTPLFSFTQLQLSRWFASAAESLRLTALRPHLYQLRHGGASHDRSSRARSMLEIKLRGRWRCDRSLRRYEKGGRLAEQLSRLDAPTRERALQAPARLVQALARPWRSF